MRNEVMETGGKGGSQTCNYTTCPHIETNFYSYNHCKAISHKLLLSVNFVLSVYRAYLHIYGAYSLLAMNLDTETNEVALR
jgi:hypothetical protein